MYELTEEQFVKFCEYANHHMVTLGMTDWRLFFDTTTEGDFFAHFDCSAMDRTAKITLNLIWPEQPTPERLSRVAYHEVLEILLTPLKFVSDMMLPDEQRKWMYATETHVIIRRLEYAKFGDW